MWRRLKRMALTTTMRAETAKRFPEGFMTKYLLKYDLK